MKPVLLAALALLAPQAGPAGKRIEVRADSRLLLITTALWLATDGKFYGEPVDPAYAQAVRNHFAPFRQHEGVTKAGTLLRRGFSYDAPVGWILHYGEPPELKEAAPLDPYHVGRAGSREALDGLAAALRSFARESDFAAFLGAQKERHDAFADRVRRVLDAEGAVKRLEAFFGEPRESYTLAIAPLIGPQNYGVHVGAHVFQVLNPIPVG